MIKKKEKKKGNKNQSDSLAEHFRRNYVETGLWLGHSNTKNTHGSQLENQDTISLEYHLQYQLVQSFTE